MKKLAAVFFSIIVLSEMPFCPYSVIPNAWISDVEYGFKWTRLLLEPYLGSPEKSEPKIEEPKATATFSKSLPAPVEKPACPIAENVEIRVVANIPAIPNEEMIEVELAKRIQEEVLKIQIQTKDQLRILERKKARAKQIIRSNA